MLHKSIPHYLIYREETSREIFENYTTTIFVFIYKV